jgi:TetR/AcrR family transcriptional regulator|uniref:TetR/AcrR family transcriptional regulator n=1 Tax=Desulfobacca acetoxidans TaxID=60893 RepID=A0A7V6A2R0_9BACT
MADQQLTRREREKLRQREEILAAALDLFSQKGYHNVSMHEIAAKAEFAIGTLYKFFQNKEDLYKTIVLERCDDFERELRRAMDQSDDEVEKLRHYVRFRSERFRNNLPFVRLFLAESRGIAYNLKAGLDDEVRTRYHGILQKLASVFASGIDNRRFKKIADPYYLAVALDSALDASLLLWLDEPERHPYPEDPDAILNIFFQGLIEV